MGLSIVCKILVLIILINGLQVNARKKSRRPPCNIDISWQPAKHVKQEILCPHPNNTPFKRTTRLYSEASGHHLQIHSNGRVDGLGNGNSEYAKLSIETVTFGKVLIRGVKSGLYLCMNKREKLKGLRKRGRRMRLKKCIFKEKESTGYIIYESLKYPASFIQINERGKAIKGSKTKKLKTKHFLQISYTKQRDYLRRRRKLRLAQKMKKLRRKYSRKLNKQRKRRH